MADRRLLLYRPIRDNNIPEWPVLEAEAAAARAPLDRHAVSTPFGESNAA
jgi:uncharacterized protein